MICCEAEALEIEGTPHNFWCPQIEGNEPRLRNGKPVDPDREKARVRCKAQREYLYSIRVEVDGRLIAVPDPLRPGDVVVHGKTVTYQRRGCRCEPCSVEQARQRQRWPT